MLTTAPVAKGQICGICDKVNDPIECSSYQTCQPTEVSARQNVFFFISANFKGGAMETLKFDGLCQIAMI